MAVAPEQRDRFVSGMQELGRRARATDGCLELAVTADPTDPGRVQNIEMWHDADALDRWRDQANAPKFEIPLQDNVARYDATDGGPMFT